MKFYCIIRSQDTISNPDTYNLLKSAVLARGLEFVELESDTLEYNRIEELVEPGSLLYRIAGGGRPALLEALIGDRAVSLKHDVTAIMARGFDWGSAIRLQQNGLPIIPTIFNVSKIQAPLVEAYVQHLGGWPVILKSAGGSHGSGVMKFDTLESLQAVLDHISNDKSHDLALRRFIPNAQHLRLVVLGEQVVSVIKYRPQKNDFRTNAVAIPQVDPVVEVTEDIKANAIQSVKVLGLEFGGVDILVADDKRPYIAEVNLPCNFARNQLNAGIDIAGLMVDFLLEKKRQRGSL